MEQSLKKNGKEMSMLIRHEIYAARRYERELETTQWSSIRKGFWFGVVVSWHFFIIYITYFVGFISVLLMYGPEYQELNISDTVVVNDLLWLF